MAFASVFYPGRCLASQPTGSGGGFKQTNKQTSSRSRQARRTRREKGAAGFLFFIDGPEAGVIDPLHEDIAFLREGKDDVVAAGVDTLRKTTAKINDRDNGYLPTSGSTGLFIV